MSLYRILNNIARFSVLGKPLFWVVLVGLMMALTTVTAASTLEDHDAFCASCHMQPEDIYDQRAQAVIHAGGEPVDLASMHYAAIDSQVGDPPFRCITCHRGDQMLGDRVTTLTIGTSDLLIYMIGSPDQSLEKGSVSSPQVIDNSCMTCHLDTALRVGFPNHFHNKLPAAYTAWRRGAILILPERSPENYQNDLEAGLTLIRSDITCIDCHQGHISKADSSQPEFYDLRATIYPVCEECHFSELGRVLGLGLNEAP